MSWLPDFLWTDTSKNLTQSEHQALERQTQAELERRMERNKQLGTITPEKYERDQWLLTQVPMDNTDQVLSEFGAGAVEGLGNAMDVPGKVVDFTGENLGRLLWGVLKGIPWWVWFVALVYLFWSIGGFVWLRKNVKLA